MLLSLVEMQMETCHAKARAEVLLITSCMHADFSVVCHCPHPSEAPLRCHVFSTRSHTACTQHAQPACVQCWPMLTGYAVSFSLYETVHTVTPEVLGHITAAVEPFCYAEGMTFSNPKFSHGAWKGYLVGAVGGVAASEDDALWPNRVSHLDIAQHFTPVVCSCNVALGLSSRFLLLWSAVAMQLWHT